ncbi:MAG: hypothetical protein ACOC20_02160 [Oceanicaulis sp.]
MALDLQINPGHGGERMESPVDQMERPTPGQRARSFHPVQEAAASGLHYRFLQYSIAEEARRGDDPVPFTRRRDGFLRKLVVTPCNR